MKRYFFYFLSLLLTLALFTSCDVEQPEVRDVAHFKLEELNKKKISFNIDVTAYNPNNYKIKVRKSTLKLYINNKFIGNAQLTKKYAMDKKTTTTGNVPVTVLLDKNVYASLLKMVVGGKAKLKIEGPLKLSVSGFPFKKDISKIERVDFKDLGISLSDMIGS